MSTRGSPTLLRMLAPTVVILRPGVRQSLPTEGAPLLTWQQNAHNPFACTVSGLLTKKVSSALWDFVRTRDRVQRDNLGEVVIPPG